MILSKVILLNNTVKLIFLEKSRKNYYVLYFIGNYKLLVPLSGHPSPIVIKLNLTQSSHKFDSINT